MLVAVVALDDMDVCLCLGVSVCVLLCLLVCLSLCVCARMCEACEGYSDKFVVEFRVCMSEWLSWKLEVVVSKFFARSSDLVDGYITHFGDG